MNTLFNYLIFPGFLFTSIAGLALNWIDRKLTARIQWRVGPPWYQPLFDVLKLFGKEITIPKEGKDTLFLIAPFFSLGAIVFASTLLLLPNFISSSGFAGDLIVILYLLMIPGISTILGGASSANPLASLGVSREIKLMIPYELPLVLAIFTPVIKTSGIITIDGLLKYQLTNGIMLKNPSCIIAFLVAIICIQAKLGSVPFDQSEAETEIMAGAYIEYSGLPLAIFKLSKMMLTFIAPILLITVFLNGFRFDNLLATITSLIKYLILFFIYILIKLTNPRLRIDQTVKFFWSYVTVFALIGVVLALLGV